MHISAYQSKGVGINWFRDKSEEEKLQYKLSKKNTLREVTLEAQTAHKEMCRKAMANMGKMQNIMTKFDRKLDEM